MRKLIIIACAVALAAGAAQVRAQGWGDLTGSFTLSGDVEKPAPIVVTKDIEVCGKHMLVDESLVIGPKKGIKNIVVYMFQAEGAKAPPIHPQYANAAKNDVVLDNDKCRFEPRVTLLLVDQKLNVGNKDDAIHNTKIECLENKSENPLIPIKGTFTVAFPKPERLPASVSCSIHPWMNAKLLIRDNPYFAVTDEDGKFTIKNVPEGKWTFQFWHEKAGYLAKETKQNGKAVTWAKGRTDLTITAKGLDMGKIEVGAAAFKK